MKKISIIWLILIQWVIAFEWIHASFPKWTDAKFIDNISKTLESFAATSSYPSYSNFLTSVAIPHAELFGQIIRSAELAVGLALVLSGILMLSKKYLPEYVTWLTAIACFGGALMNLNFFMASGSTSPSAWGLNLMMAFIQIILGIYYQQNRKVLAQISQVIV